MALTPTRKTYFLESTTGLLSAGSRELAEIAENVRWFTTLAIAGIAALAGYRKLTGATSLSFAFAVIVSLICLSLLFFLIAALVAQFKRAGLAKNVNVFVEQVHVLDSDGSVAPYVADTKLDAEIARIRTDVLKVSGVPSWFEVIGVTVFVVAALLAVPLVLFVELLSALFS